MQSIADQPKPQARTIIYIVNMNLSPNSAASARLIESAVRKVSNHTTVIEHYKQANMKRVSDLKPVGIILSGQGSPWEDYPAQSLAGIKDLVKKTSLPVLGICGGHQLIALAYGGKVDRIQRLRPGKGYNGCRREHGYVAVQTVLSDSVIGPVKKNLTVYESHYDEVKKIPAGFTLLARNGTCGVQAMKSQRGQVYGVQFHPERWDKEHADGRDILVRFLKLCAHAR